MPAYTTDFVRSLRDVLNEILIKKWELVPPTYTMLFNEEDTTRQEERDIGIVGLGTMSVVDQGAPLPSQSPFEGPSKVYTQAKRALLVPLSRELFHFMQYDNILAIPNMLANAARYTADLLGATVLNNSFTTETTRDGRSIFNTAHTLAGSTTTIGNRPSTDVDLSYTEAWNGVTNVRKHVDDRNLYVQAESKYLVVHPDNERMAVEITKSTHTPHTADNEENALQMRYHLEPVIWNLLTDTDAWFLFPEKSRHTAKYVWSLRVPGDSDMWEDKYKQLLEWSITFLVATGVTDWRSLFGSRGG